MTLHTDKDPASPMQHCQFLDIECVCGSLIGRYLLFKSLEWSELTEGLSSIVVKGSDVREFTCNNTQAIIDEKVRERQAVFDQMIESRQKVVDTYELIATKKLLTKNEKGIIPITEEKWIQKQIND